MVMLQKGIRFIFGITMNKDRIVYLLYTYKDHDDAMINPILYADWELYARDLIVRIEDIKKQERNDLGIRTIYLSPPIGEYKSFTDIIMTENKMFKTSLIPSGCIEEYND